MPVLSDPIITELLGSIEADRLMLLCGAGLSLPSPSNLLPAWRVAEICYEKRRDIEDLPDALRHDLDALAGYFHKIGCQSAYKFDPVSASNFGSDAILVTKQSDDGNEE